MTVGIGVVGLTYNVLGEDSKICYIGWPASKHHLMSGGEIVGASSSSDSNPSSPQITMIYSSLFLHGCRIVYLSLQ